MNARAALPWGAWLLLLGTATSGCRPALSQDECDQLLERYTDKLIDQTRPSATPGEHAKLISETREAAARDPLFARCALEVSRSQFECAMAAPNVDSIERCLL